MNIEQLISENQGTIVDVRTSGEFASGNAQGSINIPLHTVVERLDEIKALRQPLILCCASGGRSYQAKTFLKQQGIECYDTGPWSDVEYYQSLSH